MDGKKYYVYSELDPGCTCCNWSYDWEEWDTLEDAIEFAKGMKEKGWFSDIIYGESIEF